MNSLILIRACNAIAAAFLQSHALSAPRELNTKISGLASIFELHLQITHSQQASCHQSVIHQERCLSLMPIYK
ncbi:MAG: hypothetical protein CK426_03340 [Legionella sp.]|nr:MAG: hypothetical protein CK423_06085 [Legionella sp.]PJD99208.1 MAG: hypothetical protein CK426_03340 [Legionella sp.]